MASLRKQKGHYIVRYRLNGKPKSKSLGKVSEEDAKIALKAVEVEERKAKKGREVSEINIDLTEDAKAMTFDTFMNGWSEKYLGYLADREVSNPRGYYDLKSRLREGGPIREWFGHLKVSGTEATRRAWQAEWKAYSIMRRRQVSATSVKHEWEYISAALNAACESYGLCKVSPFADVKFDLDLPKKPKGFLTPEDFQLIVSEQDELEAAETRFNLNTGMRRGEVCILEKRRVGRDEVEVLTPKTDNTGVYVRNVSLSEGAQEARERILWKAEGGALFFTPRHKDTWSNRFRVSRDRAAQKLRDQGKEVSNGLQKGTFHWLRHTFISGLVNDARMPLPIVQQLAGHSDVNTTMKYVHTTPEHMKEAARAFSNLGY